MLKERSMAAIYLAPYAGILALLYLGLSYYVTGFRRRHRLPYGHNEDDAMQRAIRAHGNFVEYAPFGLLLPICGVLSCGALIAFLPAETHLRFLLWLAAGLVIYFGYGIRHSKLRT
ncbi:MAG: hypothetical protein DI551_09455 [Micavibrio aeruginosavorus]|uniref:Uncharacterized protein n=1 Tax=Micavibrio aeruginosavorus TaxID=349221 RepID=A0A2W5PQI1_9BACT|nr:MAG: hypothetical protein DI551_09455 [Micavibrio aeruginosavorus]